MIYRIFIGMFFLLTHTVSGQSDWVLKKEKNGIFIYGLKSDTGAFNSIKVETQMHGRVDDVVAIVMDVANHHQWAYGTRSASVLKRISADEIIFYKEIKSPGPVSDRDMVVRMKAEHQPGLTWAKIESLAMPDFIPLRKERVRVPRSKEVWEITSLTDKKIKISYYLQVDPGGSLPPFLVNLFVTKGPYETFENLKQLLQSRMDKR